MNSKERRQLENQLMVMGLAQINDPELIQQLAQMVSDFPGDRHEFLMGLLNECDDDKRYEMYSAITPHLRFKALSLDTYRAQIAERAGRMVSQRRMRVEGQVAKPIEVGTHKFMPVPQALATGAVATLTCHKCKKVEKFFSDSPAGAMIEGRKAGWIRDAGVNKELCPECPRTDRRPLLILPQARA